MNEILIGAIAISSFIVGLFFVRFWKATGDRFFLLFALSFFIESVNRISLYMFFDLKEAAPSYYVIRLIAYCLIIVAILDKNRKQRNDNS